MRFLLLKHYIFQHVWWCRSSFKCSPIAFLSLILCPSTSAGFPFTAALCCLSMYRLECDTRSFAFHIPSFFVSDFFFSFGRVEHTYRTVDAAARLHAHPSEPSSIRVPLLSIPAIAFERQHFYTRYNIKALIHKYITMICGLNVSALEFGIKETIALNARVRPRLSFRYIFVYLCVPSKQNVNGKQWKKTDIASPVLADQLSQANLKGRGKQNSNILLKIYVYFGFIKYELT